MENFIKFNRSPAVMDNLLLEFIDEKLNDTNSILSNISTKLPDMSRNVSNSGNTTIQIGDIKMEGVNDVETFGRQLREEILRNGKTTQCITEAVSAKQLGKNGVGNARLYK